MYLGAFEDDVQRELRFAIEALPKQKGPLERVSGVLGMTTVQAAIFLAMVGVGGYLVMRKRRR